jgi:hypothetical protein
MQKEIMALNTQDEIMRFFKSHEKIIFVIDQMNALKNDESKGAPTPEKLYERIIKFTSRSKVVFNSSANNTAYLQQSQAQSSNSISPTPTF